MLDITIVRQQYPHPIRQRDPTPENEGAYCVGAAICWAARAVLAFVEVGNQQFPSEYDLACVLADLNPALNPDDVEDFEATPAMHYATGIVRANDAGDFERAWQWAEAALTYPGHGP